MGTKDDEFVAKALKEVTLENYDDVTSIWAGQNQVNKELNKDGTEELKQYKEQGI